MKQIIRILLALACLLPAANAETWDEMKQDCANPNKSFLPRFGGCLLDAFQLSDKPKGIVHSFPPPGSIGFGAGYTKEFPADDWENKFETGAAISLRGFWYAGAKLRFGRANPSSTRGEQFAAHLYGLYEDRKRVSFYGLGPDSQRSNLTNYRLRLATIGGDIWQPLSQFYTAGVIVEGLVPEVLAVNGSIPSIETKFNNTTAPGLARQPGTLRVGGFLRIHDDSARYRMRYEDRISYDVYQSVGGGYNSFRRFKADLRHDFFLFKNTAGRERRDRVFTIHGLLSLADPARGNQIPFYFQETLGGQDQNNDAMLRGFDDYRFRGTQLAVIQMEYAHRLWTSRAGERRASGCAEGTPCSPLRSASLTDGILHALGVFAFYDVGQVAMQRGDLDIGRMRHSFGGGLSIFAGGALEVKVYVGLGGGEGHHTFTALPKF